MIVDRVGVIAVTHEIEIDAVDAAAVAKQHRPDRLLVLQRDESFFRQSICRHGSPTIPPSAGRRLGLVPDESDLPVAPTWAGMRPLSTRHRRGCRRSCRGVRTSSPLRARHRPARRSNGAQRVRPDATLRGALGEATVDEYVPMLMAGVAPYQATMHNITNQYSVVEGDRASVWSYAVAPISRSPATVAPTSTWV